MLMSPCSGWRMEDYKHWFVHFSPIVLRGNLLPEPYRGLWTALEGAMLHYLTPGSENSATPAGMAAGYAHLKTYAARLERCRRVPLLPAAHGDNEDKLSVPTDQVCPNLHTTACRLYMQESNVGRTCLFGELWIERDLHDLKSITTSGIPGAQLDAHIAMRVAGHNASKRLLDRAEPEAQQDYKARLKDELTQDGQQALLLGAGSAECPLQNSPGAMMRGCMKAVQDLQNSDEATPWRPWHVKQVFVRFYQRADCNDTIVFSNVYKRPSTRNNTWVSIPFRLDDDKWAIWAGHVQFWVRLEHPKLPGVFLRLAVSQMQPKLPEVVATSPNTAHFMIGVDWMTMGKNGTWSVGVILLRLLDVPAEVCGKRACSSVLAVINGGKHQSHMTGYMKAICQEVSKHIEGPGDLGVIVEPHPGPGVDGVAPARVEPVRIHGVPVVSIADTPATATLTRGMGHTALKMCYNGNISKPPNPPTEKAPLGYDSPTLQTLPGSNREEYVLIYDVRMKFTHEQIMSRGAPFIHGWSQGDPRVVGCHAQPLLPLLLQHLDARLAHLVPVYHSFMYGLLKHQLEWFMSADGLHIDVRREIVKRGAAIQSPSDLGRNLGDLANRTGWRMEDYKHWFVHFSPIVLRGNLLPEPYRGLWTALEGAMLHYLTPGSENSATPAGMAAGYAHLKTYAARLERCRRVPLLPAAHGDNEDKLSVPTDQVCPNLHTTACRLYMQESNVGRTCLFGELWIERDLHDLKSITTSGIPGAQLDAHIAMRVAGHNASKRLLDRAEPEAQQDYKARLKDELTQDGQQALLLGAGSAECPLQNSPGAMMRGCMKAVQDLQNSDEATPWRPWHVKQVFGEVLTPGEAEEEAKEAPRVAGPAPPYPVRFYQRADCNDTIVFSNVYKRPSTRNNTWVSIPFRLDDDKWAIWAGHVQFWVRLEHPKLPGVFLRLAVSRIYLIRPTSHPSCLTATGQAVPMPQQETGSGPAAEARARGEEQPGNGDAAGAAGPSGIGGSQLHRSAKRGVQQAAAGAASADGARKSQRLAANASQRQADHLPPVEDRPQRSPMGSMHQGYGDEHWYMFDATKIFTVFVTSFEDGEGYGRMFFVPAHSLSRS
ncbi:hypothetical protein V8C86DRAFT_3035645 [Haematococcus lacustris]